MRTTTAAVALGGAVEGRSPALKRRVRRDGIVVVEFDRPRSSANVFDEATLLELRRELRVARRGGGLVLMSAKPTIFIAGADIDSVLRARSPKEAAGLIRLGQEVFDELASLPVPTVAAVHGACLGGGLEMALACDWRVASRAKVTKLGLPETRLGIVPAWGGSTRLPRLIGVPRALGMILKGAPLNAKRALGSGLVDGVAEREQLEEAAVRLLGRGKRPELPRRSRLLAAVVGWKAKRDVVKRTRGNYPAMERAVDVVTGSVGRTHAASLKAEALAIGELMDGIEARNLVRLFQMQERAKKRRYGDAERVREAMVIGAGVMGAGIAQWLAVRGVRVLLTDVGDAALALGMARVDEVLEKAVRKRALTTLEARDARDRIVPVTGQVPLGRTDLVVEAAVERLNVKRAIFRELEGRVGNDTLLATNTSALPLGGIAVGLRRPERLVGLHFFNPVARMPLVEVVAGAATSAENVARAAGFVQQIGKVPVVVNDQPGFLVNRVLMPYLCEAGRMFDCGVDAEMIDTAMLDFGMPMGPLRLIDEVGADVALHVAETLAKAFPERMAVPGILREMVAEGLLGKKCGRGFYRYGTKGKERLCRGAERLREKGWMDVNATAWAVKERLVALMIDEAELCLQDGVAGSAEEVDLAMVLGTGFAPFRGGVLRYADEALGRSFYKRYAGTTNERSNG